jgi:hypothetical protein
MKMMECLCDVDTGVTVNNLQQVTVMIIRVINILKYPPYWLRQGKIT